MALTPGSQRPPAPLRAAIAPGRSSPPPATSPPGEGCHLSRRDLLGLGVLGMGALAFGVSTPWDSPARAQSATPPHRFVQINLEGGWNSAYATDPIVGSKVASGTYEPVLTSAELVPKAVDAKPTLVMGPGLIPAEAAFTRLRTAFVNGVYMEVSSHDFAAQYMSSGRLSLSNSRDYPAVPALLGAALHTFPPHVVIGTTPPLGDTRLTSPPLQAPSSGALNTMVSGPSGALLGPGILQEHYSAQLVADARALIDGLDGLVLRGLPPTYQRNLAPWRHSSEQIAQIYARNLGGALTPSVSDAMRYGFAPDSADIGPETQLAAVFLLLKSNLCPFITMTFGSFDSHTMELATQPPLMRRFARALDVFVGDLASTPDPAAPGQTLADTTTLYITSEFVRTPRFSSAGGTDHWQSASAILMGRGVMDGAVIGRTGDDAMALGWDGQAAVAPTESTRLLPDHLVATILANVGTEALANAVSTVRLNGLFAGTGGKG